MGVAAIEVANYRSIRNLAIELGPCEVVIGANGSGKTNLYRALHLLTAAANGQLARTLLEEGGVASALWAGKRAKGPVRMELAVELSEMRYELALGLPPPPQPGSDDPFYLDPEVKEETISIRDGKRKISILERRGASAWSRDADGVRVTFPFDLWSGESVLAQVQEPHRYPIASQVRDLLQRWRFYHSFRTDMTAPSRRVLPGVRTPVLAHDGSDLAAALATIETIGDRQALHTAVSEAFSGASLIVSADGGRFGISLQMAGIRRPFAGTELSDGTLRYLYLCAALLSPRPAPFLVLNEPETSLHPELIPPLASLVLKAAERSQILITTHSRELAERITRTTRLEAIELTKDEGATTIVGASFQGRRRTLT